MTEAKAFEFDDLQGLVRFAHGHLSETCFLLLDVVDIQSALEWLGSAPITTAESIRPPPDNALQVAFSANGLRTLGVPDAVIEDFSDEFVAGMASERNRSRRLGDVGANDPQQWTWGGPEREPPHMLLMLYTRSGGIADWEATVAGANFDQAFRLRARLPTDDLGRIEPFGFIDGISQPKIDWQREMSTDVHTRDRYANLLALGETVLGYPNEYGLYTQRPLIDARSDPGPRYCRQQRINPTDRTSAATAVIWYCVNCTRTSRNSGSFSTVRRTPTRRRASNWPPPSSDDTGTARH